MSALKNNYFHGWQVHQQSDVKFGLPKPNYTPIGVVVESSDANNDLFPVDEPILLNRLTTDHLSGSGTKGTLNNVLSLFNAVDFFPPTVIVRINPTDDLAERNKAIKAALTSLVKASAKYEVEPKIIGLPGLDADASLVPAIEKTADDLEAFCYLSIAAETHEDVEKAAEPYAHRRMMCIWPDFTKDDNTVSAVTLALLMRSYVDAQYGPHHCISNLPIPIDTDVIDGISYLVDWKTQDSIGNKLNEQHITTLIKEDGAYKFHGVRTRYQNDTDWLFESSVRMADVINGIIRTRQRANSDRPANAAKIDLILKQTNDDIDTAVKKELLLGGRAWIDPDHNTNEVLANGGFWMHYEFTDAPPLEQGNLVSVRTGKYFVNITSNLGGL